MLRFASLEEDGELLDMARELGDEWLKNDPDTRFVTQNAGSRAAKGSSKPERRNQWP